MWHYKVRESVVAVLALYGSASGCELANQLEKSVTVRLAGDVLDALGFDDFYEFALGWRFVYGRTHGRRLLSAWCNGIVAAICWFIKFCR